MIMRSIRNNKRAVKIPMIILTIALAISLVGYFAYTPLDTGASNPQVIQQSELEALLAKSRQLEQALKIQTGDADMQADLGNTFYDIGAYYSSYEDYAAANKYFRAATEPYLKALEINPDLINVKVDLATAAYYSGLNELAEEHFSEVIAQDPDFFNARLNYGYFLFYALNEADRAIEQWTAALELTKDPNAVAQLNGLIAEVEASK